MELAEEGKRSSRPMWTDNCLESKLGDRDQRGSEVKGQFVSVKQNQETNSISWPKWARDGAKYINT